MREGEDRPRRGRDSMRVLRARRSARRHRGENRAIVLGAMRQIPAFVRLLVGLVGDKRVSVADKLMVGGSLSYLFIPLDLLPDLIPFMGLVDDTLLLATAVRRLIRNAGVQRALLYWKGDPGDLRRLHIEGIIAAAVALLPKRISRRLSKRA